MLGGAGNDWAAADDAEGGSRSPAGRCYGRSCRACAGRKGGDATCWGLCLPQPHACKRSRPASRQWAARLSLREKISSMFQRCKVFPLCRRRGSTENLPRSSEMGATRLVPPSLSSSWAASLLSHHGCQSCTTSLTCPAATALQEEAREASLFFSRPRPFLLWSLCRPST